MQTIAALMNYKVNVKIVQSILLGYLTMDIIKECELAEIASSRFTFQE